MLHFDKKILELISPALARLNQAKTSLTLMIRTFIIFLNFVYIYSNWQISVNDRTYR